MPSEAMPKPSGESLPTKQNDYVTSPNRNPKRSIPSLDGLRAISCLFVMLAHGAHSLPSRFRLDGIAAACVYNAPLGVHTFFVISGFLITRLLKSELDTTGTISLKHFYIRRSLRIFPAYYAFLCVCGVAAAAGWFSIEPKMFLAAATYLWNYLHWADSWFLGHVWSLSIEEQFYLIWPALFLFFGPDKAKYCALGIIILSPALRVLTYFLFPESRPYISIMLHTRADALMFGCFLALAWDDLWLARWRQLIYRPLIITILSLFLLIISPTLSYHFRGAYLLPAGLSLDGVCIASLLMYFVERPASFGGSLLNQPGLSWLGRMSYSLYLWQQLFLNEHNIFAKYPPAQFLAAFLVAMASYYWIEQPALKLRRIWVRERND
jgi:peptidoglycan/LPS O-acetylase OafA/YrhL